MRAHSSHTNTHTQSVTYSTLHTTHLNTMRTYTSAPARARAHPHVYPSTPATITHAQATCERMPVRRSFAGTELRLLRAAVGTFYDLLALAVRTAEQFGGE